MVRSIGPYSLITQQPLGGKAQFGGQRFVIRWLSRNNECSDEEIAWLFPTSINIFFIILTDNLKSQKLKFNIQLIDFSASIRVISRLFEQASSRGHLQNLAISQIVIYLLASQFWISIILA